MRRNIYLLGFFILTLLLSIRPAHAVIEDTIVAIVNDDIITLNDLKDYIDARAMQMRLEGTSAKDMQKFMSDMAQNGLDRLIEDKIILNAANKNEAALNAADPKGESQRNEEIESQVDNRLMGIRSQYKNDEEFFKALLDQGVSITDVRNRIRNQIKTKRLVDQQIRAKIYVNPQEVTAFYKNHFEDFTKAERVNLDSIFISKEKGRERAQEVLAKIKDGKSFRDLAKEYSETPAIGIIKRGQALPEIEKIVFNLNTGETSTICEVDNGFYIFRLLGHTKAGLAPLFEVKDEIYNQIFQKKFQDKFASWLAKLKKEAFVDIKKNP